MTNADRISIIIPTYNLEDQLVLCLSSLVKQEYKNIEIIVVDNASSDDTTTMVKKCFPMVKLLLSKENQGVTGAVNRGLQEANGNYIWFVDHDNTFEKDTLMKLYEVISSDQSIGIVFPKILYADNPKLVWSAGTAVNLLTGINISREGVDYGQFNTQQDVSIAPANFLVRKTVIDTIGRFDNIFCISYEDADFSFRARYAGFRIVYVPTARAYHHIPLPHEKIGKERWLSRAYWTARNKIIFMKKHSPYFCLFLALYPAWIFIYTYQAIRYGNKKILLEFFRGIKDGLLLQRKCHLITSHNSTLVKSLRHNRSNVSKNDTTSVQIYFNQIGRDYDKAWRSYAKQILHKKEIQIISKAIGMLHLARPLRVLDVGIGTGRIAKEILQYNIKLTGIDISKKMINYNVKQFSNNQKVKKLFVHSILDPLPKSIGKFDVITAIRVLDYTNEWERELKNIYNSLDTNGVCIFTFSNIYSSLFCTRLLTSRTQMGIASDKNKIEKTLRKIGFSSWRFIGVTRLFDSWFDRCNTQFSAKILWTGEAILEKLLGKTLFARLLYIIAYK